MNFIEKAFEQKLTGDDFLQAMADFYNEPEVEEILDQYPRFVKDVIYIIDYDTTVQMEGFDEIINGSLEEKFDDIVTALDRCGLEDEVAVINEAKALSENDSERYDEEYDALTKKISLHNDYEGFWDAVRKYIDSNLLY